MSEKNPYAKASDAYGATFAETDQRSLESRILLKSATKLEALSTRLKNGEQVPIADISETLEYNQKLWTLFVSDAANPEHPLPKDLKNNVASLGVFIFKRTREIMINPTWEKFTILISINRNLASGLMKPQTVAKAPATSAATGTQPSKSAEKSPTDQMA